MGQKTTEQRAAELAELFRSQIRTLGGIDAAINWWASQDAQRETINAAIMAGADDSRKDKATATAERDRALVNRIEADRQAVEARAELHRLHLENQAMVLSDWIVVGAEINGGMVTATIAGRPADPDGVFRLLTECLCRENGSITVDLSRDGLGNLRRATAR